MEQYVAQQSDELTLEPTEIINVIRKTNEGEDARMETILRLGISHLVHLCNVITSEHATSSDSFCFNIFILKTASVPNPAASVY